LRRKRKEEGREIVLPLGVRREFHHKVTKTQRRELKDDAFDSVLDSRHVEVEEDAESVAGEFEVGKDLGFMDREKHFDGFEFDNQSILHH